MKSEKNKKKLVITASEDIVKRFREHIELVGYNQSLLIEKILKDFLKKNG